MAQDYTDDLYEQSYEADGTLVKMEKNFACLKSCFSGATAPSNPIAGMWWYDTTANILKLRNEANDAWLSVWDFANNKPIASNLVSADFGAALKDAAAGTASLRTLGTGAQQAAAGNDSRFGVIADGSVTQSKLKNYAAGDYKLFFSDSEVSKYSVNTPWKAKEIVVARNGTLRIKFDLRIEGFESGHGYGRIYRDGSGVGTQRTTQSTSYVTFSEDISGWTVGSKCQLYIWRQNAASDRAVLCQHFRLYNDEPLRPYE